MFLLVFSCQKQFMHGVSINLSNGMRYETLVSSFAPMTYHTACSGARAVYLTSVYGAINIRTYNLSLCSTLFGDIWLMTIF